MYWGRIRELPAPRVRVLNKSDVERYSITFFLGQFLVRLITKSSFIVPRKADGNYDILVSPIGGARVGGTEFQPVTVEEHLRKRYK